jgi:hypothetical protein
MNNLEIIVSLSNGEIRTVEFEELYALKAHITCALFLWDYNSYAVDVKKRTLTINGGRRLPVTGMENPCFVYRKRTAETMSINGHGSTRTINWLLGLECQDTHTMSLLCVSEDGTHWDRADRL